MCLVHNKKNKQYNQDVTQTATSCYFIATLVTSHLTMLIMLLTFLNFFISVIKLDTRYGSLAL